MKEQEIISMVGNILSVLGGIPPSLLQILFLAFLGILGKIWIGRLLNNHRNNLEEVLEKRRSDLRKDVESILEKERHELRKEMVQYETRFSKLHEMRAKAIKKLYQKAKNYLKVSQILSGDVSESVNIQKYYENRNDFYNYFEKEKILLSEDLTNHIEMMFKEIGELTTDQRFFLKMFENNELSSEKKDEFAGQFIKGFNVISKKIDDVIKQLEKEFREILASNIS